MPQRPLYLIGFMASGKTTLGKALCARFRRAASSTSIRP